MKYVRSISLFFVYPACCFLLGLWAGVEVLKTDNSGVIIDESYIFGEEDVDTIYESGLRRQAAVKAEMEDKAQEDFISDKYVMNPNAVSQIPEIEQVMHDTGYYIALQNNYVVVFHGDKETIFLSTDIKAEELPVDVQADLELGMYMTDEGMLYDFLENYTS